MKLLGCLCSATWGRLAPSSVPYVRRIAYIPMRGNYSLGMKVVNKFIYVYVQYCNSSRQVERGTLTDREDILCTIIIRGTIALKYWHQFTRRYLSLL